MRYAWSTLVLVAALVPPATPAFAQMAPPTTLTAREFSAVSAGAPVQLAVRVDSLQRTALRAELLDRKSDARYAATGRHVELFLPDDTPVVMGALRDVHPGALLFISGVATTKRHADVKKITVVTTYVTVAP